MVRNKKFLCWWLSLVCCSLVFLATSQAVSAQEHKPLNEIKSTGSGAFPLPPPHFLVQLQRQGIPFLGEPQFSNSSHGRDTFSPGAQGNSGGAPAVPLSAMHQPLIPR
jgi:hypothetical protein